MNILRLSTLSLTLAIAVITLGYANPASAAKPDCVADPTHPSCKTPPDSTIIYAAHLIATMENGDGEFEFGSAAKPLPVILDVKDNSLQFDPNPTVSPRGENIDSTGD